MSKGDAGDHAKASERRSLEKRQLGIGTTTSHIPSSDTASYSSVVVNLTHSLGISSDPWHDYMHVDSYAQAVSQGRSVEEEAVRALMRTNADRGLCAKLTHP